MDNSYNNLVVKAKIEKISELIKKYYAENKKENLTSLFWEIEGLVRQIDKYLKFVDN